MTFKRTSVLATAATVAVLAGLTPAAQATLAAPQNNVRHVANVPGSTGGHVVAEGNRLYVGAYGLGLTVFDISNPAAPAKIGEYKPGVLDGSVRADAVPDAAVINGRHIVTLNGTNRAQGSQQTEFLDMTDPAAPTLLARFTGGQGEAHNGDVVDSRKLWLPSGSGGSDSLRIYDMSPLLGATPSAPVRLNSTANGNLTTLWNASPYKAVSKNPNSGSPTHIHDLEVYTDYNLLLLPSQWVDQNNDGIKDPTYALRDLVFMAASQGYPATVGAGTTPPNSAVYIVDITNPASPVVINKIQARTGHRYLHEVQILAGNPRVMFTSDEDLHSGCDAGGVYSWTLSEDLTEAVYRDTWFNGTGTPAGVCSAHVFSSAGNYVFMGSYQAGLQVIDFSNPADIKDAGEYIAEGANSWGALYYRGMVYVGDFGGRGLDVFQFAAKPVAKGLVKTANPASREVVGVTETLAACEQGSPTDGVDALIAPIPAANRGPGHTIRAMASEFAGTEVDIWFYDSDCDLLENGLNSDTGGIEQGGIPSDAAFASATLFTAAGPQNLYVELDPTL